MEKSITVYKNETGHIYFIDNSIDYLLQVDEIEPNFTMIWEKSEILFNDLKKYQDAGYKLIFK